MVYSIVPRNGLPPGECVCLFIWSLCPIREFFTHMETSPLPVKAANLTYARKSWPLSSESYLTCHTCCDTGLSFIMVISEDPWHSHLLPNVCQWSCHYRFLRLRSCLSQANLWTLLRRHGPFTSGIAYHSASLELLAHPKIHEWNSTGLPWPVLYSLPWWNYY